MVNNFDTFPFDRSDPSTFYFFQIINRRKQSWNNKVRCIKSYFIDSKEYLDKKRDEMTAIADLMWCRVYVHPARRSKEQIWLRLIGYVADCVSTKTVEKLSRCYETVCWRSLWVEKRWIVDVDSKNELVIEDTVEHIKTLRPFLKDEDIFINRTVNWYHVITKKWFDLSKFDLGWDVHKNNPTVIYWSN